MALAAPRRVRSRIVARVKEHALLNLGRKISLDELTLLTGMTKFRFLREFRKAAGVTPYQFLLRLRLGEAMRLLRRSDLTVTAISERLGFYNTNHLVMAFKKYVGVTPGTYRKALRASGIGVLCVTDDFRRTRATGLADLTGDRR